MKKVVKLTKKQKRLYSLLLKVGYDSSFSMAEELGWSRSSFARVALSLADKLNKASPMSVSIGESYPHEGFILQIDNMNVIEIEVK